MNNNLPTSRHHRTALVIDIRNGVSSDFENRYKRLLESVNGDNIKVDVFTLRSGLVEAVPALVEGSPDESETPDNGPEEIDLVAWASGLGFTQLLLSIPVN